jgi:hypothetical protein
MAEATVDMEAGLVEPPLVDMEAADAIPSCATESIMTVMELWTKTAALAEVPEAQEALDAILKFATEWTTTVMELWMKTVA